MAYRSDWTPLRGLRHFAFYLGKKDAVIALAWVGVYFGSQWVNIGALQLFSLLIGTVAGVVIGWWLAEDAVEEAGFSGFPLWVMLIVGSWLPIIVVEWVMGLIMHAAAGWHMTFARWMLISCALILSLASAVWRAAADN